MTYTYNLRQQAACSALRHARALSGLQRILHGEDDRSRTQRDALTAFAVRVASAGILYLSQIVLARWMGGHEYGIYVYAWTWVLLLGGLSHLGLNMAMIRLVPEYSETSRFGLLRGLLYGGRVLALGVSCAATLTGILAIWVFEPALPAGYVLPLTLALVCVPFYALTDVQDGIGRGKGWMGIALMPPYVLRPLLVLASLVAVHWAGWPMVAWTAALAAILATSAAALVQTLLVELRLARELPRRARTYDFRGWLSASFPLLVIGVCEILLQTADVLVVSRYMTPADAGVYFAAAKTMSLILFVNYSVGSAVANRFAALNARGDTRALEESIRDAVRWTFWPSLVGTLFILAVGRPVLALFGPGFAEGHVVMLVLAAGFLLRASVGPAEFLLNMLGAQQWCAGVLLSSVALDMALLLALVPPFGIVGAAIATATALAAAAIMNYWVARRRLGLHIAVWSAPRSRHQAAAK